MPRDQLTTFWKKGILYWSPFVLGCFVQILSATDVHIHNHQTTFSNSLEKTKSEYYSEGERLYNEAVKQLETIEKLYINTNSHKRESSYTDRIIQKVLDLVQSNSQIPSALEKQTHSNKYKTVTSMLEQSAREYQNNDALLLLAELNFFSKYNFPRNYHYAFDYYTELASRGNATAQQMIGFIYTTGIGQVVERDPAKALLYHTFAAHGGDTAAEMTMGYHYLLGIGTDESCEDALYHYKNVANKAIDYYLSGPPGGHQPPFPKIRLSEENGGVYGFVTTEKKPLSEKDVGMDEILKYWKYLATKQDIEAQLMLGQVYYIGIRNVPRNHKDALFYLNQVVDRINQNGKITTKDSKWIGKAAGFLGLMNWRGDGVDVNENAAYKWFQLGSNLGDSTSQNYLGMMYLDGVVVRQNREKAIEYFKKSADQDNPHGQVNLAIEYLQSDSTLQQAIRLFTKSAESKHLLAYWYLALLNEQNLTTRPSCRAAVSYYKAIAEKGDWFDPIVEDAYAAYKNNDRENALLYYMMAAERGYEVAQTNVAYLLDEDKSMLPLLEQEKQDFIHGLDKKKFAFIYWTQSANQNNADARVKMGDYYYKGIGTEVNLEKAVSCYRIAAEMQASPLAFWNLGWMYENGVGVSKDFHLAKRAYDQALHIDQDAYLPVQLSLLKMYIKYYWEWLMGHEVGPAFSDDQGQYPSRMKKKVEKKQQYDIGEELERQYKIKKQQEREEQERREEEGYYDDEFGEYSDGDDMFESLLILALCLLVGYLVYVRQFRFGNNNQENQ